MHRKYIRATVSGVDVDIPISTFNAGEYVRFVGGQLITSPAVSSTGSSTPDQVATWVDSAGAVLQSTPVTIDSSGNVANVASLNGVTLDDYIIYTPGGIGPFTNEIACFDNTSKPYQISYRPIQIDASGNMIGVTTLNTRNVSRWVDGPVAAVTADSIALWDGITGRLQKQSVVVVDGSGNMTGVGTINGAAVGSGDVVGPASATDNAVARFDGITGKLVQNSLAILNDAGNLTGLTGLTVGPATLNNFGDLTGLATLNSKAADDLVVNSGTANIGEIPTYTNTNGKVMASSGVQASSLLTRLGATTDNRIARWNGTIAQIQTSVLEISDTGQLTGVTQINNEVIGDYCVREGVPAVTNPIAVFGSGSYNGSLTTTLIDITNNNDINNVNDMLGLNAFSATGGTFTNLSTTNFNGYQANSILAYTIGGVGLPLANEIAAFDTTSFPLKMSYRPVTIDASGNIVTSGTLNGVSIASHVARHLPGGADEITINGTSWDVYDSLHYNGAGNVFTPKYKRAAVCGGLTIGSSAQAPSNATISLAPRAESYVVYYDFCVALGDTSGSLEVRVSWSSGTGRAVMDVGAGGTLQSSVSNGLMSFSLASAPSTFSVRIRLGVQSASAGMTVSVTFRKSSGVSATLYSQGTALAVEV